MGLVCKNAHARSARTSKMTAKSRPDQGARKEPKSVFKGTKRVPKATKSVFKGTARRAQLADGASVAHPTGRF